MVAHTRSQAFSLVSLPGFLWGDTNSSSLISSTVSGEKSGQSLDMVRILCGQDEQVKQAPFHLVVIITTEMEPSSQRREADPVQGS